MGAPDPPAHGEARADENLVIRYDGAAWSSAVTLADGDDIAVGSTTGTQLATAATQKLGLFGTTPVVQPAPADQAAVTLGNVDGDWSDSQATG